MQRTNTFPAAVAVWRHRLPGLLLVAAIAALAAGLAAWPALAGWGLSALTLAILLGMLAGNLPASGARLLGLQGMAGAGIDFARARLLRLGIVLFGFRISLADIAAVGLPGIAMAVAVVGGIFWLAMWLGTRHLGLDRDTAALIGAGSAICGAAAVMGAQSVIRAPERSVSVAVATVVVFGTLSMLIYPLMYPLLAFTPQQFGLYAGATIHEVAQVVAVGAALGLGETANAAVIEKMLRVVLLAPFLLLLAMARTSGRHHGADRALPWWQRAQVPWFALAFLVAVAIHSLGWLPPAVVQTLVQAASLLLAMGMVAIGLRTSASSLRAAGLQPLKLAALLFVSLLVGGYLLTRALTGLS